MRSADEARISNSSSQEISTKDNERRVGVKMSLLQLAELYVYILPEKASCYPIEL
jgi:hypothetical protein